MLARVLLMLLAACMSLPATAHEYRLGGLEIVHPWARASAEGAKNGAAYLDIVSHAETPDRLIAARSPQAASTELHMHMSENGIMTMRPVEAVEIAPGEHVVMRPGSFHIMLLGLSGPLVEGQSFPLVLTFGKAGEIEVSVTIASAATMHSSHGASPTVN